MKIRIEEIPGEGLRLDLVEEGRALEALAGDIDFSIASPVEAHLEISRSGSVIDISGDVTAAVSMGCSRCLKEFSFRVSSSFRNRLVIGRVEEREKELTREDMDEVVFEGEVLDTGEVILEQVVLEIPQKPLCRPYCNGLCPVCGTDLNEARCSCARVERVDPRFAGLRGFKVK